MVNFPLLVSVNADFSVNIFEKKLIFYFTAT